MKKFLSAILAAALLCVSLCSCGKTDSEDDIYIPIREGNQVNYETANAYVGTILEQVVLDGTVTSPYTRNLSFLHIGGTIKTMNLRQDFDVKEGDILAVLDDTELEDQIVVQELTLNSAKNTYETLISQHADEDEIEFAKIAMDIEQIKYDGLIDLRESLVLRAPFDGRIVSVGNYREGSHIDQGATLCTISDSSRVSLTANDYGSQLSNVMFGTSVEIRQGSLLETTGKVVDTITSTRRMWGSDDSVQVNSYVIKCDEDVDFLELGGIEVTFTTLRRDDAVIVPSAAVFESTEMLGSTTGATTNYVNVLMNGIKVQTPVTVGVVSGDKTEILSGLSGNETLIL